MSKEDQRLPDDFYKKSYRPIPKWLGWGFLVVYLTIALLLDKYLIGGIWNAPMNLIWRLMILISLYQMGVLMRKKGIGDQPMAEGRLAVLVPAYNEDEETIYRAIDSLLEQTRVPDEIHVVDDGSRVPIKPYVHERVFWHRQENKGKRHAQVAALRAMENNRPDFILTIDSDSVTNIYGVEYLLRAMSNPKIEAVTGMIYGLNTRDNLLTRVLDLNTGISCLMTYASHNALGAQETTNGPLTMYRARVLYDNIDNYLTSGTYGDDRRLNIYSLLYGDTLGIYEASTFTQWPTGFKELFRQRLRWAKSPWLQLPFMLINLEWRKIFFPIFNVIQWLVMLLLYFQIFYTIIVFHTVSFFLVLLGVFIYVRVLQAALYMYMRPNMAWPEKLYMVICIAPLEVLLRLFFITPIKTIALFNLRKKTWGTRVDK